MEDSRRSNHNSSNNNNHSHNYSSNDSPGSATRGNIFRTYREQFLLLVAILAICFIMVILFFKTNVLIRAVKGGIAVLMPFIYGAAIAWLLRPVCRKIEAGVTWLIRRVSRKEHTGLTRSLSMVLSLVVMYGLIVLLLLAVLPELISSIRKITSALPDLVTQLKDWLQTYSESETASGELAESLESALDTASGGVTEFLQNTLLPSMQTFLTRATSSFGSLVDFVKNFGLGTIVAAYLLGGWERFVAQGRLIVYGLLPRKAADWVRDEVHFSDRIFSGFIIGKIVDSAIIGVLCFIFCELVSMPYSMLISVIVGVTNVIPFFGPYIGAIPSALLVLTVSPKQCVVFVIFIIVLQQFDGNILGPSILGDRLGISGIWILFSIMIFSHFWGFAGMLLGVPVFAILYDLFTRIVVWCLRRRGQDALVEEYKARFAAAEKAGEEKKKPTIGDLAALLGKGKHPKK